MAEAATAVQLGRGWSTESPCTEELGLLRGSDEGEGRSESARRGGMSLTRSVVQQNLHKSTDFLRWIVVPVGGQGGVMLSYVCPHCRRYAGFNEEREEATGGPRRAAVSTLGGTRTASWLYRTGWTAARRRCFGPSLRRTLCAETSCAH